MISADVADKVRALLRQQAGDDLQLLRRWHGRSCEQVAVALAQLREDRPGLAARRAPERPLEGDACGLRTCDTTWCHTCSSFGLIEYVSK